MDDETPGLTGQRPVSRAASGGLEPGPVGQCYYRPNLIWSVCGDGRDGRPAFLLSARRAMDRGTESVDGRPGLADLAIICESREISREASRALCV